MRDDLQLDWPCARIDGAWLTFGFDEDLGSPPRRRQRRDDRADGAGARARADDALALASVVVDLRVTQVVNEQARGARGAARRRLAVSERLRLWLERDRRGAGYHLRDAATGERVEWEDPRVRVVPVAGVSFRPEAVADASFDPGARLALVPEPGNEHDPNAVGVWNEARTLQAGYVPREAAAELVGTSSRSRYGAPVRGLRVLLVPAGSWVGRPRR